MKSVFEKKSTKFNLNRLSFTEVMVNNTFWCVFYAPQCTIQTFVVFCIITSTRLYLTRLNAESGVRFRGK
jgi:hypothetical protein